MKDLKHRCAATDTKANRLSMYPRDIFMVGDRIQVHGVHTKHHGRIARIRSIGELKLSVDFEDGQPGTYVHYTDAVVIPERGAANADLTPPRLRMKNKGPGQLRVALPKPERLGSNDDIDNAWKQTSARTSLGYLSKATASIVASSSREEDDIEQLIIFFERQFRSDVRDMINQINDRRGQK